jgi:hypothetical protein
MITSSHIKLSLVILLFLVGCTSVKPTTSKGGKRYFETFFVGDEGTQYFIKPISFQDEDPSEDLFFDFTFRYKNEIKDSAIVNLSIVGPVLYKSLNGLKLSNGNATFETGNKNIKLLFNEKNKKGFLSRFSTKVSLKSLKQLFESEDWLLVLYHQDEEKRFEPPNQTKKAINTLKENVFSIM